MELRKKYLYLLFICPLVVALTLFNAWKEKQRVGDLEAIQLLSPDRSVLNLFLSW
jgi:hypothetical protein